MDYYKKLIDLQDKLTGFLVRNDVKEFHIAFTGSFILKWFGLLTREPKDIDVLLYVDNRKHNMWDLIESYSSENNMFLEESPYEDESNLYKIKGRGEQVDILIHRLDEFNSDELISIKDLYITPVQSMFVKKAKWSVSKTCSDLLDIFSSLGEACKVKETKKEEVSIDDDLPF